MHGVCGPCMHRAVGRGESKPLFGSNCSRLRSLSPSLSARWHSYRLVDLEHLLAVRPLPSWTRLSGAWWASEDKLKSTRSHLLLLRAPVKPELKRSKLMRSRSSVPAKSASKATCVVKLCSSRDRGPVHTHALGMAAGVFGVKPSSVDAAAGGDMVLTRSWWNSLAPQEKMCRQAQGFWVSSGCSISSPVGFSLEPALLPVPGNN